MGKMIYSGSSSVLRSNVAINGRLLNQTDSDFQLDGRESVFLDGLNQMPRLLVCNVFR